ncbi:hypothetical protein RUM44_000189 [Polyplax serrata]|uniref:Uncharacterized protein n=1 Tax=Polyplax serrata TaxID=468196 RepID=A0ABR1B4Q3_POLSC
MDEDSQNYLSNDTSFKLTYSGKEGLIKMSGKVPKVVENMCEKVQHLRKPHTWILVKEKYDSRKGHADCYTPLLIAPEEMSGNPDITMHLYWAWSDDSFGRSNFLGDWPSEAAIKGQ